MAKVFFNRNASWLTVATINNYWRVWEKSKILEIGLPRLKTTNLKYIYIKFNSTCSEWLRCKHHNFLVNLHFKLKMSRNDWDLSIKLHLQFIFQIFRDSFTIFIFFSSIFAKNIHLWNENYERPLNRCCKSCSLATRWNVHIYTLVATMNIYFFHRLYFPSP